MTIDGEMFGLHIVLTLNIRTSQILEILFHCNRVMVLDLDQNFVAAQYLQNENLFYMPLY